MLDACEAEKVVPCKTYFDVRRPVLRYCTYLFEVDEFAPRDGIVTRYVLVSSIRAYKNNDWGYNTTAHTHIYSILSAWLKISDCGTRTTMIVTFFTHATDLKICDVRILTVRGKDLGIGGRCVFRLGNCDGMRSFFFPPWESPPSHPWMRYRPILSREGLSCTGGQITGPCHDHAVEHGLLLLPFSAF